MAYNTTASLDKLICTNFMNFGKNLDRFGQLCSLENESNYLDVKFKVFKRGKNIDFCLVPNLTMGEVDFNRFIWLSNQLVFAAENFCREENSVLIPKISKDMDEHLKLTHNGLKWWTKQTKRFVWLFCCAIRKSQRVHMLKSDFFWSGTKKRSSNNLFMWFL